MSDKIGDTSASSLKEIFLTPKIVPFLVTTSGYFILLNQKIEPSFFAVVIKCSPVISLMVYAVLRAQNYKYVKSILLGQIFCCIGDAFLIFPGQIFCCIGDAFLIFPGYFELGVLAFTFGHIHYILAFGWNRTELKKGIFILCTGICVLAYLLPSSNIKGNLSIGVPIYVVVIDVMVWRAIARIFDQDYHENWKWIRKISAFAAVLFAISDFLIASTMFQGWPNWSPKTIQFLVMSTYYLAQFGIALSVSEVSKV